MQEQPRPAKGSAKRLGLLLLSLAFLYAAATGSFSSTSPLEGQHAPTFSARIVGGAGQVSASSFDLEAHRGRTVVLDFWASWCPPCRASVPVLAAYAQQHPEVDIVGINVEGERDEAFVRRAHEGLGGSYPTLHDTTGSLQRDYAITQLPTLLVIEDGVVTASHVGAVDAAWLQAHL